MQSLHILLVEDNDALREVTAEVFTQWGHRVTAVDCAEAVSEHMALKHCDVAVLDLNLPGEDGVSLARRLRTVAPDLGIVMITVRDQLTDRLHGYDGGADLYLTKPTDPHELCAAVMALGKRVLAAAETTTLPSGGQPTLNMTRLELSLGARSCALTPSEAKLLHGLALAQTTLEHWQLLEILDKPIDEAAKKQLEVVVSRLRAKLEGVGLDSKCLQAERGHGYRLNVNLRLV